MYGKTLMRCQHLQHTLIGSILDSFELGNTSINVDSASNGLSCKHNAKIASNDFRVGSKKRTGNEVSESFVTKVG